MTAFRRQGLVLWDIDNTLLTIRGVSREIYALAFERVIGRPLGQLADMAGRTERAIIRETLQLNGVEDTEDTISAFYTALGAAACSLEPRMRVEGAALPGGKESIAALAGERLLQSVVTGNIRPIATTKLAAFGLAEHLDLDVGGFGDDSHDRAVLVRLAITRAETRHHVPLPARHVVVIGDTPHDIKGAHDVGALAIGVATGSSSADELLAVGADRVLHGLADPAGVRGTVLGVLCHS